MSEELAYIEPSEEAPITWHEAWFTALLRPYLFFYESLAKNPGITTRKAYLWIIMAGFISYLGCVASILIYGQGEMPNLPGLMFLLVLYVLAIVVGFAIIISFTHLIAKFLGGVGSLKELTRLVAAFTAPILILMGIVALIPLVQLASYGLIFYGVGLSILSVKAVYQVSWAKSTVSCSVIILFMLFCLTPSITQYSSQ